MLSSECCCLPLAKISFLHLHLDLAFFFWLKLTGGRRFLGYVASLESLIKGGGGIGTVRLWCAEAVFGGGSCGGGGWVE